MQHEFMDLFERLSRSKFRSRFKLAHRDREYVRARGFDVLEKHARAIIDQRLAPAQPLKDGKQTPYRGHPVFIAQHATATCCRSCLEKWHGIARGRELTREQCDYVVAVLMTWIRRWFGR